MATARACVRYVTVHMMAPNGPITDPTQETLSSFIVPSRFHLPHHRPPLPPSKISSIIQRPPRDLRLTARTQREVQQRKSAKLQSWHGPPLSTSTSNLHLHGLLRANQLALWNSAALPCLPGHRQRPILIYRPGGSFENSPLERPWHHQHRIEQWTMIISTSPLVVVGWRSTRPSKESSQQVAFHALIPRVCTSRFTQGLNSSRSKMLSQREGG